MPRVKEKSDDSILEGALKVIIKKGPTSFSLMDVSKIVGLSPATLLQRFGSKKGLLTSSIAYSNQLLLEDLNKLVSKIENSETSGLEAVVELLLGFAKGFKDPKQVAQGLDILKLDIIDPELNRVSIEYFSIRKKCIVGLLSRARERKEIPKNSDLEAIASCLEAVWQGTIMQWALFKSGSLSEHLRRNLGIAFTSIVITTL